MAPWGQLRRWLALVVALVLAATLTACGGSDKASPPSKNTLPSASASPKAQAVTATGLPDGTTLQVADSSPGIAPGDSVAFVSPVYALDPAGALGQTVTLTLTLDNALPSTTPVVAATRATPSDSWTYVPARLTSDQRHVTVATNRLQEIGALSIDLSGIAASFRQGVRSTLGAGVVRSVKKPTCAHKAEAKKALYSVAAWKRKTLGWCLDEQGDKTVLKVVNRRTTPVQVAHADSPSTTVAGKVAGPWTTWSGVLTPGSQDTFLAPGGSATYDVTMDGGAKVRLISAESDAVSQSLRVLQATARALVAQLDGFGVTPPNANTLFARMAARPQCAKVLGQGAAALLRGCLSLQKLVKTFGTPGRLLEPLFTAAATRTFYVREFKALALQDQQQLTQHIVVKRAKPDFAALVGFFNGPGHRAIRIDKEGLVTEHYATADGKVIDLTYQLTEPTTKDGTTSATATVVGVHVYNRKAIKGQPPRKGDTGTISVSGGVVHPPFLGTTYCDGPAMKKGKCGKG